MVAHGASWCLQDKSRGTCGGGGGEGGECAQQPRWPAELWLRALALVGRFPAGVQGAAPAQVHRASAEVWPVTGGLLQAVLTPLHCMRTSQAVQLD